jgi:hypothetical protein
VRDAVRDFSRAQGDRIDLSEIDANLNLNGDNGFHSNQLAITKTSYGFLLTVDILGAAGADMAIEIHTTGPFGVGDIIL